MTCSRGSALRSFWGDCLDNAQYWNFLICKFCYVETASNELSCPVHVSSTCLILNWSWRLPGEKVCNCLPSRGSIFLGAKNSCTQILELPRGLFRVFLLLLPFASFTVVTAGLGLWLPTSGREIENLQDGLQSYPGPLCSEWGKAEPVFPLCHG